MPHRLLPNCCKNDQDPFVAPRSTPPADGTAGGGRPDSITWLKLHVVADAFEQELLTNIAEAEFIGQDDLAAEWRLELNNYRAAMKQTILEEQALGGSSADAGRDALGRPRSDQP
jgi:hypothetical protein